MTAILADIPNNSGHPCTIIHLSLSFFINHWYRVTWRNPNNSAAESICLDYCLYHLQRVTWRNLTNSPAEWIFALNTAFIIYRDLPEEILFIQLLNQFLPALPSLSFTDSYLKKSINSAAESISAWITVFAWPSMVAAFSFMRYLFAIRSAALCQIFSLSSSGTWSHVTWAAVATSMPLCTMSYCKKKHTNKKLLSDIISK